MQLSPTQRKFVVYEHAVGAAIVNLLLNLALGWLSFRGEDRVGVWTDPGMAIDLSATVFLLPVLLCLISTPLIRHAIRTGKVEPLLAREQPALLRRLPSNLVLRSLLLGVVAAVLLVPGLLVLLRVQEVQQVSLAMFVADKALLGCVLAGAVAPIVALQVLSEPSEAAPT